MAEPAIRRPRPFTARPSFEPVESPDASVIIPVHGKWPLTLGCLHSLARSGDTHTFEVIVVDDGSPDDTAVELDSIAGAVVVGTASNVGFVGACNLGASRARGSTLVFLNNDTEVEAGWLDRLLDVFYDQPDVGLVGAMLLGTDGTVQESGGIVWSDGSAWNYGRGEDRQRANVRALRDVDYCSGAAIAVRRSIFVGVGGFDTRYSPAYYEDTDLCMAVRALGHRVVVQPEAVVVHLEGATHGADGAGGLKRFQSVNRQAFVAKWRSRLAEHGTMDSPADLWRARHRSAAGLVLVVDATVPMPDRDSGSRRMDGIVRQLLAMGHSVHFAVATHTASQPYTKRLERLGVTVLVTPDEQECFFVQAGRLLEAVILCRPDVAWSYLDGVYRWAPQAKVIFDTVDLHGLRIGRQANHEDDPVLSGIAELTWLKEQAAMRAADVTLVVSSVERDLIRREMPGIDVRVLSNIHEPVDRDPQITGRSGILFVGGFQHPPNLDAATWAARQIMPIVRRAARDATLRLVGSFMPPAIAALSAPGVEAIGWVPDLSEHYRRARVVIAPLRYGAGVKGKVAEAIEFGVPVVGTPVAFEGMSLEAGVDMLCADSAEDLAAAVIRLLTDDDLWRRLAGHGQAALHRQFAPERAREVLDALMAEPKARRTSSLDAFAER